MRIERIQKEGLSVKKVAVLLAPGYEEGEALLVIDILRRGKIFHINMPFKFIQIHSS
jgi:hypothetical protein